MLTNEDDIVELTPSANQLNLVPVTEELNDKNIPNSNKLSLKKVLHHSFSCSFAYTTSSKTCRGYFSFWKNKIVVGTRLDGLCPLKY